MLHGGFNSVLDALVAGVPIVAVPIAFEQPATAARLAWTGAGRVVPMRRARTATLAEALRAVLEEPSYRAAARRLAAEMRPDGAREAAALVSAALA
jgi:UDP:flavonoid glycosyltransferase YjiC (YdhE family)